MSQLYGILPDQEEAMTSICCTPKKPDYLDLSTEEKKKFCKLVYLLRKRGHSVKEAQEIAYRDVLEESIPFDIQP
jgi:hypothetical protein